jgi:hypothetical protein
MQFAGPLAGGAYGFRHGSSSLEYTEYIEHNQLIKYKDLLCQLESTLAKGVIQA